MDFIFHDLSIPKEDREDTPVYVYGCDSFPKKKFPADKYELVSQATRINVSYYILLTLNTKKDDTNLRKKWHWNIFFWHLQAKDILRIHHECYRDHDSIEHNNGVVLSVDGVNECNSTSRSLEILSMQFANCNQVYPCIIFRPEVFRKKSQKQNFEAYVSNFIEELQQCGLKVLKLVADAPERAASRHQKQHGGAFSCDVCIADPQNMAIPGKRGCKIIK